MSGDKLPEATTERPLINPTGPEPLSVFFGKSSDSIILNNTTDDDPYQAGLYVDKETAAALIDFLKNWTTEATTERPKTLKERLLIPPNCPRCRGRNWRDAPAASLCRPCRKSVARFADLAR